MKFRTINSRLYNNTLKIILLNSSRISNSNFKNKEDKVYFSKLKILLTKEGILI